MTGTESASDLKSGQIVKALAGYYYVNTGAVIYMCRARGIFKKDGITPLVGDYVRIAVTDAADEEGVVEDIEPRRNAFIRPPVANVDIFLVTVAAASPEPNLETTDKFLVSAEAARADAVICVNKDDLSPAAARRIAAIYRGVYPAILLSAATGEGVAELAALIRGKSVAFAGASGVGKTSLLSRLTGIADLAVGDISRKTERGKHTTRHVEIFRAEDGTRIYDTPGFTAFEAAGKADIPDGERADQLFPEFRGYLGGCRFDNCRHDLEPGCAVRDAVDAGKIRPSRYRSYLSLIAAVKKARETWSR
ncbi:MAG: ribosome small subunit-dependent GTPase A [Clostridiales Family XIII bacterium]|jgi:ribosome biogenesis GTPase|nr:ribosome small subunit-dependent GTPase A [Clostridiales Family XIII bacterium]